MKYYDNYRDIKSLMPFQLRDHLRGFALDGLSFMDRIRGIEELLNKPRVQFLYIHHVFKDEEKQLEKLLARLARNHTFISYSEAISRVLEGRIDKPYISISSDDGFKNNLNASRILDHFGASGCFFINPALIGETSFSKIENHCRKRLSLPPVEFLSWDEVADLQKRGHEIGSHTMEHINVAVTPAEIFANDCARTFEIITSRCGEVKHFAFPYGRFFHFNEAARKIVFENGFYSCATAERGCHVAYEDKLSNEELCILRDHVILDWNLDHIFHFLASNSRSANPKNNFFPYSKS